MKTELSAGGIIARLYQGSWQILLMKDMNNVWTFPKGKIEKGETKKVAATREIQEEVGLENLTLLGTLPTVKYKYKRNGVIDKTVYYFLFQYTGRKRPVCQKEEGITAAKWISPISALKILGYPDSNMPLIQKTLLILEKV
jgi:8-oxo-dGTP pyrophosphatase MutT (NUDIX family)